MRIIFVGVHNKPGLNPLCSSTKSGRVIDEVIAHFEGIECLKTNLYDLDRMPTEIESYVLKADWNDKYKPRYGDVVVCLGREVKMGFDSSFISRSAGFAYVPHPANRHMKKAVYVDYVVSVIKSKIK